MNTIIKFTACTLLLGIVFFISCKKELSCENCKDNNKPPIADAGADQTITLPKDSVMLDGSASTDPDGTITSNKWTKIAGPVSSNIGKPDSLKTIVKGLVAGVYKFELTVTDNGGLSAKDTVLVIVDAPGNQPPVACAGADITLPINSVSLDGNCSADPDNNITSYAWLKISGPSSFNIANASAAQTQVTNLVQGTYLFELKVTDAGGLFSKDTIQITVNNYTGNAIGTLSEARIPSVAAAGSKIVFAGGLQAWVCGPDYGIASSAVDIYDTSTHTWTTAQLSVPRWGMGAVACGNKIFFAGGENGQWTAYDNVDIYDVSTNTWTVAHLSTPRGFLAAATVGNKVFFAGGYNYPVPITKSNKVDIYDLSTNNWSTATLSVARSGLSGTTAGNKIYFAGGGSNSGSVENIDIYDNTTNTWSTSSLQYLTRALAGVAAGDKIYWAGGVQIGQTYLGKVEIRNVTNGTTTINGLSALRSGAVLKNDEIVFFGGNHFDIYNTITDTWSVRQSNQNISGAVISVNNAIYVAGGHYTDSNGCVHYTDKVYAISW